MQFTLPSLLFEFTNIIGASLCIFLGSKLEADKIVFYVEIVQCQVNVLSSREPKFMLDL